MRVLEILMSRSRERHNTAAEALVAAANRIAADEAVDPGTVERALVDAGKDVAEFERLCELAKQRREWRSAWDRRQAADAKKAKAQMALDKEREAFEAAHATWVDKGSSLEAEIAAAASVVDAADVARARLVMPKNVPGPLGEKLAAAIAERDAATERVAAANRELREVRQLEKDQRDWCQHKREMNLSTLGGDADDHERRANRAARRAGELLAELQAAQSAEEAAAANVKSLEAAALKL